MDLMLSAPCTCADATIEAENAPSDEEIQLIENMEREKIAEFLKEKHMSNANLRRGK